MSERVVRLFRSGGEQAFLVPEGFELPGREVVMRKVGERIILEPIASASEEVSLDSLAPIEEDVT